MTVGRCSYINRSRATRTLITGSAFSKVAATLRFGARRFTLRAAVAAQLVSG